MPAMNSAPTDVLVATAYITITIDGGIRMPSAPEVVMTPATKRAGKPCLIIAGRMIDPIATTVAGELPDTAANSAHAITPARPRPPAQWPTIDEAKLIIRRATPPWVRKLPARMKNGIAMISNFSIPVKSLSATDWIGTVVIANRYVSTVSPSEIEIGIPVSIRPNSSAKMIQALAMSTPASFSATGTAISTGGISAGQRECPGAGDAGRAVLTGPPRLRLAPLRCPQKRGRNSRLGAALRRSLPLLDRRRMETRGSEAACGGLADPFDVRDVVVRQLAGARERPCDLQEAEAHQVRGERDA